LRILASHHKPDFIAVVETWLTENHGDCEIDIANYNFIRRDRKNDLKTKGGGIIFYFRQDLSIVDITTTYNSNIDHLWIKVLLKHCRPILFGIFYRPPDCDEEQLNFLLEKMATCKTVNTIIIGDFNYGDINWRTNTSGSAGKKFLKFCTDQNLLQCVKEKTRGKNILDLAFVYDKNLIYKISQLAPLAKSDHNVVNILLNVSVKPNKTQVKSYNYNKAKYNILEAKLNEVAWEEVNSENTVNECWELIRNPLNDFKEKCIPSFSRNTASDVPWMNNKLKKLIKKRNNLFKRYKKIGQSFTKVKYIIARNNVNKEIKLAKKKYECKIIKRSKNNRKIFYTYIASKNRKNCSKRIGPLIDSTGRTIVDDKDMASVFNNYFASVFTKQTLKIEISPKVGSHDSLQTLNSIAITESDVIKSISEFKEHKSPGLDGITSTYAIKTKDILAKQLCLLYNSSLAKNQIPDDWKKANISPIFKKGAKSNVENYRPVSLTCFHGKVLEKIIKKNIEAFLCANSSINNTQHGFMKGRSCLTNLLICKNSIVNIIDEGSSVDIIYLDFQKAFDKVPHSRLMDKVRNVGIGGALADWIENWLLGRTQRVVINGCYSDYLSVTSGVPQGSILGPLLFTIYINDLENGINNNLLKFADDSKLWGRVDSVQDRNTLQKDLDTLGEWAMQNQMPFNIGKCKIMHIGKRNAKFEYFLNGCKIASNSEEKDLGVYFSESFKPNLNCDRASKAANKIIGMIARNISNRDSDSMLILYKTLVRPVVDYCIPVWRPNARKDITKLEKIQKRFTKMIDGCKKLSYEQRLSKLKLTSLEDRHYRADMIQVFKILNDNCDIFTEQFLELSNRAGRKNSLKLFKRRNNLDIAKFSFTSRVVDPWNELPDAVVLSEDVNAFKSNLDKLMRSSRGYL